MNPTEVQSKLTQNFPFEPTPSQTAAIYALSRFIASEVLNPLLVLQGYAGTGKTSLIISLVKLLPGINLHFVLLAPTGRAAKVMASYTKQFAFTIHKKIYAVEQMGGRQVFTKAKNPHKNTIFIVDEASMISSNSQGFGGNSLLDDLASYVFEGKNCKLLLLGDDAQLPPVHETLSPALNLDFIKSAYPVNAAKMVLTDVMRQAQDSGILSNATFLRNKIEQQNLTFPLFNLGDNLPDIKVVTGYDVQEGLESAYAKYGWENTMVICRSNRDANQYNNQIRTGIKWHEEEIVAGDYLMVVKNNYFWLPKTSSAGFIANGDIIEVLRVGRMEEKGDFRFINITIRLVDYPEEPEYEIKLLLNTLSVNAPALNDEENKALFSTIQEDYLEEKSKSKRMELIKKDPFYNALQVKYAYAITCHKSQGGQWDAVFVDQGYMPDDSVDIEYLRWLYTAVTRASKKLYLLNFKPAILGENPD